MYLLFFSVLLVWFTENLEKYLVFGALFSTIHCIYSNYGTTGTLDIFFADHQLHCTL